MAGERPFVYVVDDDPEVLAALERLLRSTGFAVRSFASPAEFLESADERQAGCLLLDLAMPEVNGLELQSVLEGRASVLPIVFLTGHGDIEASVRAMKHGAVDFLTKPADDATLVAAVRAALAKADDLRRGQAERESVEKRLATLTAREREVLDGVVAGRLNKQIAAELGTAEKTVKVHRGNVMRKMQVRSLAELVKIVHEVTRGSQDR